MDLSKYFDKEVLVDAMNELHKVDVKGKLYKLIYELNKDVRIRVRTPVGESEKKEASECISQGSIDAGIVSSVNLGKGVDDFFGSSDDEISYGSIRLLHQAFQDDLCRLC